jgi:hypothetical protein
VSILRMAVRNSPQKRVRLVAAVIGTALLLSVSILVAAKADPVPQMADDMCGIGSQPLTPEEEAAVIFTDLLRDPKKVGVLYSYVEEVQGLASEFQAVFAKHGNKNVNPAWLRPVAQECVRQFRLSPKNIWTTHKEHLILCLGYETGWTLDPKSTGADAERGQFQFIPSTARDYGYDFTRMGGTSAADIRYQIQCGFSHMAHENTVAWARTQWTGFRLADRDLGR